jgi:hypothetical protein
MCARRRTNSYRSDPWPRASRPRELGVLPGQHHDRNIVVGLGDRAAVRQETKRAPASGDIDAVAKRFGVTRRFVEGRLRLAALAEPIFEVILSWWKLVAVDVSESSASSPVSTMTGTS